MIENSPLVSVVVITYNSEKYILETLESVKDQTYDKIELIISDDGSSDNTVNICENWLNNNNEKFIRTEIISVEKNTGIPSNCNRGIASASGYWIKIIAGDDALIAEGISEFVRVEKSESHIFQTVCEIYKDVFSEKRLLGKSGSSSTIGFFSLDSNYQYRLLKYWNYLSAPTVFFKGEIFDSLAFDAEFQKIEDYPFWILATKNGFRIGYADVVTVKYRIHSDSVQNHDNVNSYRYKKSKFELTNAIRRKYYKNTFFVRLYFLIIVNLSDTFQLKKLVDKLNISFRFFATFTFSLVNKITKTS